MKTYQDMSTGAGGDDCRHEVKWWGRNGVVACPACGVLEFFGPVGLLDRAEGVAALFGNFELVDTLPAVGAPGTRVLAYRPSGLRRSALDLFPLGVWLRAGPELWLASDGTCLLLSTDSPLMVSNLTRGA